MRRRGQSCEAGGGVDELTARARIGDLGGEGAGSVICLHDHVRTPVSNGSALSQLSQHWYGAHTHACIHTWSGTRIASVGSPGHTPCVTPSQACTPHASDRSSRVLRRPPGWMVRRMWGGICMAPRCMAHVGEGGAWRRGVWRMGRGTCMAPRCMAHVGEGGAWRRGAWRMWEREVHGTAHPDSGGRGLRELAHVAASQRHAAEGSPVQQ